MSPYDKGKIVEICSICGKPLGDEWGNNAWPINEGRCCYNCNWEKVNPARLAQHGICAWEKEKKYDLCNSKSNRHIRKN